MSDALKRAVAAGLKRGGSLEDQYRAALLAFVDGEDTAKALALAIVREHYDHDQPAPLHIDLANASIEALRTLITKEDGHG